MRVHRCARLFACMHLQGHTAVHKHEQTTHYVCYARPRSVEVMRIAIMHQQSLITNKLILM